MRRIRFRLCQPLMVVMGLLMTGACRDATAPTGERVGSIIVSAPASELTVGGTVQLQATFLNQTGVTMSTPQQVVWSSTNDGVVTVSAAGLATGRAGGTATVSASSGGRVGSVQLRVLRPQCTTATTRTIGTADTRAGTLSDSDCVLPHDVSGQGWRLDLASPTTLQLDLTSGSFDALLVITDMQFNIVGWDDDGGGGLNARLVLSLSAGQYIVWATGTHAGSAGAYQLTTRLTTLVSCITPVGAITVGQTATGTLTTNDCLHLGRTFADPWALTISTPVTLQLDLTSQQFDTYLVLADRDGVEIAHDDDGGEGLNSRLVHTFTPGEYLVLVRSYSSGETGSYRLDVREHLAPGLAIGGADGSADSKREAFRRALGKVLR